MWLKFSTPLLMELWSRNNLCIKMRHLQDQLSFKIRKRMRWKTLVTCRRCKGRITTPAMRTPNITMSTRASKLSKRAVRNTRRIGFTLNVSRTSIRRAVVIWAKKIRRSVPWIWANFQKTIRYGRNNCSIRTRFRINLNVYVIRPVTVPTPVALLTPIMRAKSGHRQNLLEKVNRRRRVKTSIRSLSEKRISATTWWNLPSTVSCIAS